MQIARFTGFQRIFDSRVRSIRRQISNRLTLIHCGLAPLVFQFLALGVVLRHGYRAGDGHIFRVEVVQDDGFVGLYPRIIIYALIDLHPLIRGELDRHIIQRGLERRRFPHLGDRGLHLAGQAVGQRAVVVEVVVAAALRALIGLIRIGVVDVFFAVFTGRDLAEHLLVLVVALLVSQVFHHHIDVLVAVLVVLG